VLQDRRDDAVELALMQRPLSSPVSGDIISFAAHLDVTHTDEPEPMPELI
jgi:hypothetical protein